MKKVVLLIMFSCSLGSIFAQSVYPVGVKTFIGAAASQNDNLNLQLTQTRNGVSGTFTIRSVGIQVGMPYMGVIDVPQTNNPTQYYLKDLGFPWGIRYRYNTFSEDAFVVSKGYYADKVSINWAIKNNANLIADFVIYRTIDINSDNPSWGTPIVTLSASARSFDDNNTDGGKLYKYKVVARGVESVQYIYSSYITGVGYRNATAIITGNVSFKSGTPVKNVLISASPTGTVSRFGTSIQIPSSSTLIVPHLHEELKDSMTLQAWLKPMTAFNGNNYNQVGNQINLFTIHSNGADSISFKVGLDTTQKVIGLTFGNHIITLKNYIPSGDIDNQNNDILIPINRLNDNFTHFTAVLRDRRVPEFYINGRLIDSAYSAQMNRILINSARTDTSRFTSNKIEVSLNKDQYNNTVHWNSFSIGGGKSAYVDDIRVFKTALLNSQIITDYRRYLRGNEPYLHTYLTLNEQVGKFAYDLSSTGVSFHGNDARLDNNTIFNLDNIPTTTQLGILGVSDANGNYVISSVPYAGSGTSYTIVPSLGVHQFNPNQQLVYIGVGSTVINNVNFKDISSFKFKGKVVYDSKGIFPAIIGQSIKGTIRDGEFYNAYMSGYQKYQKGEYWAFKNSSGTIDSLMRYAAIPVPGAIVSIDNQQAINSNNEVIITDNAGNFEIDVPIGQHAISITKIGHQFLYDGRYPAKSITTNQKGDTTITNTYQDFFEDQVEPITFIDTTKVMVIGRVVGGKIEADKTIGFGDQGKKTYTYRDATGVTKSIDYTSINNIGRVNLILGYTPLGSSSVTPEYQTTFTTNKETGEFRVKLLPLSYSLIPSDLTFISTKSPENKPLLSQTQTINFTNINTLKTPIFKQGDTTINGAPYHEILKYTYTAPPTIEVRSQTSDSLITLNNISFRIASNQATPVYSQFGSYRIEISRNEYYYNYDSISNGVRSTVPINEGELIATNNLALENSESKATSSNDPSILVYSFRGGMPNTIATDKYQKSINLKYRIKGVDYQIGNLKNNGILLGGVSDGSQTFVTAGPQIPDFVLRDPPGSNSFATIDKGSSFTFSKASSYSSNSGTQTQGTASLGFELSVGGSVLGPVIKTDVTNDVSSGVTMAQSSSNGTSVENTYTFNQSISTSNSPNWVGSDADLYIGYSANQFYGTYNKLTTTLTRNTVDSIKVVPLDTTTTKATLIYPILNKEIYFNESPEKTFFIYSQRSIINDLIPKYEEFIRKLKDGTLTANTNGVLTVSAYESSINLWRKIILNNELSKYRAYNNKDSLKTSLNSIINGLKDPTTGKLSSSAQQLSDLLNATFFENISFDAGIGAFTKSYQVNRLSSSSLSYQLQLDASIGLSLGASVNNTGFTLSTSTTNGSLENNSSNDQKNSSSNVSYSLNDPDANNLLSVDVINPFDGNGPIFITKGGETSCPYEGPELSHYYNPTHSNVTKDTLIIDLPQNQRVPLSLATMKLEIPEITVLSSNVSNIPEGRNAEFVLYLRNTSTKGNSATFKLMVDQATNPNNALINIQPNGTIINIPAGQTVTFTMTLKKVKQDIFTYDSVKVSLQSLCDDNAISSVFVTASFVPACSPVSILSPSNNWLLNRNTAYASDVSNNITTRPIAIRIGEYNTSFSSFKQINLEYRLQGTPDWTGLRTYYKDTTDLRNAISGGDNNVELIIGSDLNYPWDIAALGLSAGIYEIRGTSTCYNRTTFESNIIIGRVDLDAPVVFGTPTPTNGILGIGDDITVRFNKPVKINGTVTKFEFSVQQNQMPVGHQVSLSFNGTSNKATINKPYITTGDFSIEFWMKNLSSSNTSILLNQSEGLKIELINGSRLKYTLGGQSIIATIRKDSNYNHYTLSYNSAIPELSIIENDQILSTEKSPNPTTSLSFTNSNPIVIGGSTFIGNIHDLRIWSKPITRDQSVANMNVSLTGSESDLLGFWPMNEGNGSLAKDLARYKNLDIVNANWDIFPKGTAYNFTGANYLKVDSFQKVIISKTMDATVTFWMKTAQSNATILSNGKGDSTDLVESNQFRNKWAFNTNVNGELELAAEGKRYSFGNISVNDNSWHHVAVSLVRNGGLKLYVDGNQVGSFPNNEIGGLSSSSLFIGSRGSSGSTGSNIDRYFVGQVDELCIWNMGRTAAQIKSGMYFESNFATTGLLFYSNFNKPASANNNGPLYYYPFDAFRQTNAYASLNGQALNFTNITPAIKQYLPLSTIPVTPVINNDQIVLSPNFGGSGWANFEGKVANITVSNLNDMYDNRQLSPVTWSLFINKNPIKMYIEGQGDIAKFIKTSDSILTFQITITNQGGLPQPYSFKVPRWLTLSSYSGVLDPNKTITILATIDKYLAPGTYDDIILLATNYGIDKKVQLNLRVLVQEPNLNFNPANYKESMNIVGKMKIDGIFSNDTYDKVYAIAQGVKGLELRGKANLTYDIGLDMYNVYLTVYSDSTSGEIISFFIWDASQGNLLEAKLDSALSVPFVADRIIGNYTRPAIFENTNLAGHVISLLPGWTWVSFNVNDPRFLSLNDLTRGANLSTSDLIQSNAPALFDSYQFYAQDSPNNGWAGGISSNGGITNNRMYKFKLSKANELKTKGIPTDLQTWSFNLQAGWNWLPFVVNKNIPIGDALANLDATDGDLIKSQNLFSIYSATNRAWKGTLNYLLQSEGYMINVSKPQRFTYPNYLNRIINSLPHIEIIGEEKIKVNGVNNASTSVFINNDVKYTSTITPNYSKFANTMNAVVKLPEGFNELYFYNDAGELRGNSKTISFDGKDLAFITIYSDKPEKITAFIGANNDKQATTKSFNFSSDAILGSITSPIVIELPKNEISIYPNPFKEELKVAINSKEKGDASIVIVSMATGQILYNKVFKINVGSNILKLSPIVPAGAYVINVKIGENVLFNNIIKIN